MPDPRIGVAIPVGPSKHHADFLDECLTSVRAQTSSPSEVLIVSDMADLSERTFWGEYNEAEGEFIKGWGRGDGYKGGPWRVWSAPWRLGIPAAFNAGVALCDADYVLMLGADDWLEPFAIERVQAAIREQGDNAPMCYYYLTIRYSDDGETQSAPNNCAVVSKTLWRATGGFPPESAVGACDTMFISQLIGRREAFEFEGMKGDLIAVDGGAGTPLYNYRRHADSDTGTRPLAWQDPIFKTRDLLTRHWKRPEWGRYS